MTQVRRVEFGGLLIVYGLWAHSHNNREHLSLFACAAVFSVRTDADDADHMLITAPS